MTNAIFKSSLCLEEFSSLETRNTSQSWALCRQKLPKLCHIACDFCPAKFGITWAPIPLFAVVCETGGWEEMKGKFTYDLSQTQIFSDEALLHNLTLPSQVSVHLIEIIII